MYLRAVLCRTNANARRQVTKQKKGNAELSKIALWMIAFGLNGNHCTWSAWDLPKNDLVREGDVSFSPHISRLMDVSALLYPSCARPLTTIKEELQTKNNFIALSQSWCSPKELLFFSLTHSFLSKVLLSVLTHIINTTKSSGKPSNSKLSLTSLNVRLWTQGLYFQVIMFN